MAAFLFDELDNDLRIFSLEIRRKGSRRTGPGWNVLQQFTEPALPAGFSFVADQQR